MDQSSIEAVIGRLDRLERENQRLARANRWWKWVGLAAIAAAVLSSILLSGRSATVAARADRGVADNTFAPAPEPIRLGIGTRVIEAEHYLLRDQAGNLLAVLAASPDGSTTLGLHARSQSARMFLRVSPDGEPGIIFFDKEGKRPVEMGVSREGKPALKVIAHDGKPIFGPGRQ